MNRIAEMLTRWARSLRDWCNIARQQKKAVELTEELRGLSKNLSALELAFDLQPGKRLEPNSTRNKQSLDHALRTLNTVLTRRRIQALRIAVDRESVASSDLLANRSEFDTTRFPNPPRGTWWLFALIHGKRLTQAAREWHDVSRIPNENTKKILDQLDYPGTRIRLDRLSNFCSKICYSIHRLLPTVNTLTKSKTSGRPRAKSASRRLIELQAVTNQLIEFKKITSKAHNQYLHWQQLGEYSALPHWANYLSDNWKVVFGIGLTATLATIMLSRVIAAAVGWHITKSFDPFVMLQPPSDIHEILSAIIGGAIFGTAAIIFFRILQLKKVFALLNGKPVHPQTTISSTSLPPLAVQLVVLVMFVIIAAGLRTFPAIHIALNNPPSSAIFLANTVPGPGKSCIRGYLIGQIGQGMLLIEKDGDHRRAMVVPGESIGAISGHSCEMSTQPPQRALSAMLNAFLEVLHELSRLTTPHAIPTERTLIVAPSRPSSNQVRLIAHQQVLEPLLIEIGKITSAIENHTSRFAVPTQSCSQAAQALALQMQAAGRRLDFCVEDYMDLRRRTPVLRRSSVHSLREHCSDHWDAVSNLSGMAVTQCHAPPSATPIANR